MEENAIGRRDYHWKISERASLACKFDYLQRFLPDDFRTVLDVAAGTGALSDSLAKWKSHEYTMIDISHEAVRQAHSNGLQAIIADIETEPLPFSDNSFDLVVGMDMLEHLRNPWSALAEMTRVSGRYVFIHCPNFVAWPERIRVFFGQSPLNMRADQHGGVVDKHGRHIDHIYFMTYKNFMHFAKQLGLEVVSARGWWYRRYAPLRWLLEPFFKSFCHSFEVILKKPQDWSFPSDPNFRR